MVRVANENRGSIFVLLGKLKKNRLGLVGHRDAFPLTGIILLSPAVVA
jgi:hypothetical protein